MSILGYASAFLAGSGTTPSPLLTGLAAYWKLDGNGDDELGAHDATQVGHPPVWQDGKIGGSVTWDNVEGAGSLTFAPLTTTTTFTIALWISPVDPAGYVDGYGTILVPTSGTPGFYMNNSHPKVYPIAAADASLTPGVWQHLAIIADGERIRYYINGVVDNPVGPAFSGSMDLEYLGGGPAGSECIGGEAGNGAIDDVGVWTRCLTEEEILMLYNSGVGLSYPFITTPSPLLTDLAAYWKLDGNSTDELGTYSGTDTLMDYQAGKIGDGAIMDQALGGATSKILIPALSTGTAFTIAGWVFTPSSGVFANTYGSIISQDGSNALFLTSGAFKFKVNLYTIGAHLSATELDPGTWYHIAVTATGSLVSYYINGVVDANTFAYSPNLSLIQIFNDVGFECFRGTSDDGMIDELGVWSRVLTSDEIVSLYAAGAGLSYPF